MLSVLCIGAFQSYIAVYCSAVHLCPSGPSQEQGGARRRGGGRGDKSGAGDVDEMKNETLNFSVEQIGSVQTDLNPKDPLQKCVRFSADLKLLLAGGTDGHIRVWEVRKTSM